MKEIGKVGIIDLGTNSIRFDVQKVGVDKKLKRLHREKMMIRLGDGVFVRGRLDANAVHRTLQALQKFKAIATELRVDQIVAFGTCTLREVEDSDEFIASVKKKTGISIRIISGDEEAKLIAKAILAHEPHAKGRFALADIGGGSTEISVCRNQKILHCVSFPLGVARLNQTFLKGRPLKDRAENLEQMRSHIRHVLRMKMVTENWPRVKRIIGSSGTIKALSRIFKTRRNTKVIHYSELKKLITEMQNLPESEIAKIPGMDPRRVDMILDGSILLEQIMEAFKAKVVYPTLYALRDGMLMESLAGLKPRTLSAEMDLFPFYAKASQLGCSEAALKKLVANTDTLFSRLSSQHMLSAKYRDYLLLATVFRDTGWTISPVGHTKHSYYIVKNSELPFGESWEVELVAQLCLHQEVGMVDVKRFFEKGAKRKAVVRNSEILLALFRVVDALGPAHQEKFTLSDVLISRTKVRLVVPTHAAADIVKMRLEHRRALFEKVFGKELEAVSRTTVKMAKVMV